MVNYLRWCRDPPGAGAGLTDAVEVDRRSTGSPVPGPRAALAVTEKAAPPPRTHRPVPAPGAPPPGGGHLGWAANLIEGRAGAGPAGWPGFCI